MLETIKLSKRYNGVTALDSLDLKIEPARLGAGDYDRFPNFAFREESSGAVARRVAIGLIGLVLPALIIGRLALRALRRYPLVGY
jgi:hypothetical protein